jgi:hypothetical protein
MGIDGTSTQTRDDDASAAATGDGGDKGAERPAGQQAATNDTRSQRRAETLTRDQYADAMRAGGSPMQRDNRSGSGESSETEPPGEFGRQDGQVAGYDRAEPRDRETYADDIRADRSAVEHQDEADAPADLTAGTALDSSAAPNGHQAEQATANDEVIGPPTGPFDHEQHDEAAYDGVRGADETDAPEAIAAGDRTSPVGLDSQPSPAEPITRSDGQERWDTLDPRFSVVEADRTLGDTTPTGIGLKPTGDQLLEMDGDKPPHSRLDRFIGKAFESADDLHDGVGDIGEAVDNLRSAPTASGHSPSHDAYTVAVHDRPPTPQGPGASDVMGSIAISAVAALAGVRRALSSLRKGE